MLEVEPELPVGVGVCVGVGVAVGLAADELPCASTLGPTGEAEELPVVSVEGPVEAEPVVSVDGPVELEPESTEGAWMAWAMSIVGFEA